MQSVYIGPIYSSYMLFKCGKKTKATKTEAAEAKKE